MDHVRERSNDLHASLTLGAAPAFGREMRRLFNFAPTYTPLNHGSYGTFPHSVFDYRQKLLLDYEARPSVYKKFVYPKRLHESRALVAPLLGADVDEVVFVTNATTGVNVVLRNLIYKEGDVVLHFSSIYPACRKTIQSLQESTSLSSREINIVYPLEDEEIIGLFKSAVSELHAEGKRVKLAVFDTIVSGPGVRVPWEGLVAACREQGILSLVDGAHGIGHIDMTHTGRVSPDFLVTNCHK